MLSTFSSNDLKILRNHFHVRSLIATTFLVPEKGRDWLVFFRLIKGLLWTDVVYAWWVDLNAFFIVLFCKVFRKKCVFVVGGYEVAYLPKVNYGTLLNFTGRLEVKYVLKYANKILAVSKFSKKEITQFVVPREITLVYNGIDTKEFYPAIQKENMVLTVASRISQDTVENKRLDIFLRASKYLPNTKFVLVGKNTRKCIENLKKIGSPNVEFTGYLDYSSLLDYYQKAKVYCQLSAHESFGVALAEAMCCECIPVVARRAALPEIVDDTGFYVPYNDIKATINAIRKALTSSKGLKARERIEKYFSFKERENRLIKEILDLVKK
jgi:glycosyltransferase involved in cell wall biosynthesis